MTRTLTLSAGLLTAVLILVAGCAGQRATNPVLDTQLLADTGSLPTVMPEVVVVAPRFDPASEPDAAEPIVMPEVLVTAKRSPGATLTTAVQGSGYNMN